MPFPVIPERPMRCCSNRSDQISPRTRTASGPCPASRISAAPHRRTTRLRRLFRSTTSRSSTSAKTAISASCCSAATRPATAASTRCSQPMTTKRKTLSCLTTRTSAATSFNDLRGVEPIAAGTDMFVVTSTHSNSNQSYELDTPMFLRGGKLQAVTTIFIFSATHSCRYGETQSPHLHDETRHAILCPERPRLRQDHAHWRNRLRRRHEAAQGPQPRRSSDIYRWNGKTFAPATKAVERLSDANWKSNNE